VRVITSHVRDVQSSMRFDSRFFLDQVPLASILVGRWPLVSVKDTFGEDRILLPNIFERVPADSLEFGKPILVPYDCFRYLPYSNDILSRSQVATFNDLEVRRGWLLIVCSGRNLGPVTFVDRFLEKFVLSHDMIRICAEPSQDLFYFAAFMNTALGQALIRRDRNGSVIDHLDAKQVGNVRYPLVDAALRKKCAQAYSRAFLLRESARMLLHRLSEEFLGLVGLADFEDHSTESVQRRFSIVRSAIVDRFDSEPFAPRYKVYRRLIRKANIGRMLGEIAEVVKPPGRYKTNYVESEEFGIKLMSGRQIAQYRPIGLKYMSRQAWKIPTDYVLTRNIVVLTADGRAEENLADCALIRRDREGWAASGHVHRLVPRPGIHPGLLYLACSCKPVQALLKSLATGSVVDALSDSDVASISIPYPTDARAMKLGELAVRAWDKFAAAAELENEGAKELQRELVGQS
jgi:hypothetical protein